MTRYHLPLLCLALLLLAGISSCKDKDSNPIDPPIDPTTTEQYITLALRGSYDAYDLKALSDLDGELRDFKIRGADQGMRPPVTSNGATTVKLNLFLRQMGNPNPITIVADANVEHTPAGSYRITLPETTFSVGARDLSAGDWYCSGIVTNSADVATAGSGEVTISAQKVAQTTPAELSSGVQSSMVGAGEQLTADGAYVPVGFGWRKLEVSSSGKATLIPKLKFEPLGFWIHLRIANHLAEEYIRYGGIYIHEAPFSLRATLDAKKATDDDLRRGRNLPAIGAERQTHVLSYLPSDSYAEDKDFITKAKRVEANSACTDGYWYVWAIPTSSIEGRYSTARNTRDAGASTHFTIEIFNAIITEDIDLGYTAEGTNQSLRTVERRPGITQVTHAGASRRQYYRHPTNGYEVGNVYDIQLAFDSEPIISEVYHYTPPSGGIGVTAIEIYNPTTHVIDLSQYGLIRQRYTGTSSNDFRMFPLSNSTPTDNIHRALVLPLTPKEFQPSASYGGTMDYASYPVRSRWFRGAWQDSTYPIEFKLKPGKTAIFIGGSPLRGFYRKFDELKYEIPILFQIEHAVQRGYCQMVVLIDNPKIITARPDESTSGVLTMGPLDAPWLVKKTPHGTYRVVDATFPNPYSTELSEYRGLQPSPALYSTWAHDQDSGLRSIAQEGVHQIRTRARTLPMANISGWGENWYFTELTRTGIDHNDVEATSAYATFGTRYRKGGTERAGTSWTSAGSYVSPTGEIYPTRSYSH